MSDIDPASNLRQRLAEFETSLTRIRTGKEPAPTVDLLAWTAETRIVASETRRTETFLDALKRNLREDWNGLQETVAGWAARIDERFSR